MTPRALTASGWTLTASSLRLDQERPRADRVHPADLARTAPEVELPEVRHADAVALLSDRRDLFADRGTP